MPGDAPAVSEHQRTVLYALKRRGEATADDLAESLGMTVSGARQHLSALSQSGLVEARSVPAEGAGGRGRPRLCYGLTPKAEALFPKAYGELTNELLSYVADEDGTLIDRIFVRRRDHRVEAARARMVDKRTMAAKVQELARILDEDGYLAESEDLGDGRFRITEHNCAVLSVARNYPNACASEIEFIRAVLPGATVERVSHIIAGQHHCAYVISN
jgi:DeoR family transcriptional regulator, suf operon transcriptional repressor